MPRPTYANVMSTIAVFLALGGISWAAVKLPRNSVGSKQIKKSAVRSSDVKNGALTLKDFKPGQVPDGPTGPKGDPGTPGAPGAPGSARAHARVTADNPPQVVAGTAKNVESVSRGVDPGLYCIELAFEDPRVLVATPDNSFSSIAGVADPAGVATLVPSVCPTGTDAVVGTGDITGEGVNSSWNGFSFWIE